MRQRARLACAALALLAVACTEPAVPAGAPTATAGPRPTASPVPTATPTPDASATAAPGDDATPGDDRTPDADGTPDDGATPGAGGGTLRYGIGEPTAIVPPHAVSPDDLVVVDALFDALTTFDAGLSVIPAAAVSWSSDEDQRVWTFRLRAGARFHPLPSAPTQPGPPVTAADVKFAWEQAVRGPAGFRLELVEGYGALASGVAEQLAGVEATDPRTLVVRLAEPLSTFPAVVAHPSLAPVPRALWEADEEAFREQPVGNGPFRAAEAWVRGQFIRAQRVPDWANAARPASIDEVLFTSADPDAAYVAFQQGRLQVSPLPVGAVEAAVEQYGRSADGYHGSGVLLGATPTLYFLGFNAEHPPFDEPEIRRAVSLAVDRAALVEAVGAHVEVADSLLGPSLPNGGAGSCEACVHDPRTARRIFAEHDVQRLRLSFNRDGGHLPIARAIRDDLARVGVVLELSAQARDLRSYLEELADGDAGMFRYGWTPEHPVLDELLHPLFHSSQVDRRNYMRYAEDDVDALIDGARASPGALRRVFLSRRAEDLILNRDQAIVPLLHYRNTQVVDRRVRGYRLDAMGRPNLHEITLDP